MANYETYSKFTEQLDLRAVAAAEAAKSKCHRGSEWQLSEQYAYQLGHCLGTLPLLLTSLNLTEEQDQILANFLK